jgi:hypothetical protein
MLSGTVVSLALLVPLFAQTKPEVPVPLTPPAAEKLILQARGDGDQIYSCQAAMGGEPHFEWVLVAPDAKLFDQAGKQIGTHFAGPTWQATDGSQAKGKTVASKTQDPNSIPWLLLTAIGHSGNGLMSNVSSIQRLRTKGGKAPGTGCDSSHQGERIRIHYTADYYFYSGVK